MNATKEADPARIRQTRRYVDGRFGIIEFGLDLPQDTPLSTEHEWSLPKHPTTGELSPRNLASLPPIDHVGITMDPSDTNTIAMIRDPDGKLFVRRSLRKDGPYRYETLITYLANVEYPAIGFIGSGRTVSGRSFPEQAALMERAASLGLPVVLPVYVDEETMITPFISGHSLKTHLETDNTAAIGPALTTLRDAHSYGLSYGDRWTSNMRVREDNTVVPIDFEVELGGRNAAEFEMAQLMYAISGQASLFDKAIEEVRAFCRENREEYNWQQVVDFMQGYNNYLAVKPKLYIPRLGGKLDTVTQTILT